MMRKAVTLTELLIGIALLGILAGAFALSPNLWRHNAKREAERLAAKLTAMTLKADRTRTNFTLQIDRNLVKIEWQAKSGKVNERFYAQPDFVYEWNANGNKLTYSHTDNKFLGGTTISVQGKDEFHYVIIHATGGRIRTSYKRPSSDE